VSKKLIFLSLVIGVLVSASAFAGEKYMIDPVHSSVGFSIRHLLISNVRGDFTEFSGTIDFDEVDITKSSVDVNIKTFSIDTDNTDRDKHLASADFFDGEKFPEITFKSSKIEKSERGLTLTGMLTMHGVTKEVIIPFEFIGKVMGPMGKERLGFEGSALLDRKEFGITWNKTLDEGGLALGNEVKVELNIEAVKM
jgi:polyisoprenoid-binding protein YceI